MKRHHHLTLNVILALALFLIVSGAALFISKSNTQRYSTISGVRGPVATSVIGSFFVEWNSYWYAAMSAPEGNPEREAAKRALDRWISQRAEFALLAPGESLENWQESRRAKAKEIKGETCVISDRYDAEDKVRAEQWVADYKSRRGGKEYSMSFMVRCLLPIQSDGDSEAATKAIMLGIEGTYYVPLKLAFDYKGKAFAKYPADGFHKGDEVTVDGYLFCQTDWDTECAVGVVDFRINGRP